MRNKYYTKTCLNCGKSFETDHFKALYCCEKCGNAYRRKRHYKNHPEYYKAKRQQRREQALEKGILARIKSRAKSNNIPFNLTLEDIIVPDRCPVLNIPLVKNHGHKGYFADSPSVDRIIPELGYTKGNIRVISNRANLLKNNATVQELELVLNDLRGIL